MALPHLFLLGTTLTCYLTTRGLEYSVEAKSVHRTSGSNLTIQLKDEKKFPITCYGIYYIIPTISI